MNILILGGTTEASELVRLLAGNPDINVTLSLAGRTKSPTLPASFHPDMAGNQKIRIGGFGGGEGLAEYIKQNGINTLICATHPFAAKIPFNAKLAAEITGIPLLFICRKQWEEQKNDNWIRVASHKEAVEKLGDAPKRVFLSIGRLEVGEYSASPQHFYLIRSIEEIDNKNLPNAEYFTARPPYSVEGEKELLTSHKIDCIISKNSGGKATEAKIIAARELAIPIIMISRPARPSGVQVETASEALEWVEKSTLPLGEG